MATSIETIADLRTFRDIVNGNAGTDVIVNGDFSNDGDGWTLGTGWSIGIGDGAAVCDGTQNPSTSVLARPPEFSLSNTLCKVTFTITNLTSGSVAISSDSSQVGTSRSLDGTYSEWITFNNDNDPIGFIADSDFVGEISDIIIFATSLTESATLLNNLTMDSAGVDSDWESIGGSTNIYNAEFNGGSYTISDLKITGAANYKGLFGYTNTSANIHDLTLSNVSVVSNSNDFIGALVGRNFATISDCVVDGIVSGDDYVGGITGHNSGAITDSSSNVAVTGGDDWIGGLVGQNVAAGTITSSYAVGNIVGGGSAFGQFTGGLVGENNGTIDTCYATGNITNAGNNCGGLCGLSSLTITDSYSTGSVTVVSGSDQVGGLIGYNINAASVAINSYSTSDVIGGGAGSLYIGGFVGRNSGDVDNCYATGEVTNGDTHVGGFCGYNELTIDKCYATGDNNDSITNIGGFVGTNDHINAAITNCYSIDGIISGSSSVFGGFCGLNNSGNITLSHSSNGAVTGGSSGGFCGVNNDTITTSYYNSTTTGQSDTGKGVPLTSSEYKVQANFTGFDFNTVWFMTSSMPDLRFFIVNPDTSLNADLKNNFQDGFFNLGAGRVSASLHPDDRNDNALILNISY